MCFLTAKGLVLAQHFFGSIQHIYSAKTFDGTYSTSGGIPFRRRRFCGVLRLLEADVNLSRDGTVCSHKAHPSHATTTTPSPKITQQTPAFCSRNSRGGGGRDEKAAAKQDIPCPCRGSSTPPTLLVQIGNYVYCVSLIVLQYRTPKESLFEETQGGFLGKIRHSGMVH